MERLIRGNPQQTPRLRSLTIGVGGTAALLAVAHGVNDMFASLLPALLPGIQARFSLGESTVALLVGAFAFSSSFLGPFLGSLSDRLGAKLVSALGITVSAALLSLIGIVPNVTILFMLLLVAGLGSAALHPAGSAMARATGERHSGIAMALFSAGGMIGYALGPLLVLLIVDRFGVGATAWLMLPGLAIAALFYFWAPDSQQPKVQARPVDRSLFVGPVGLLTVSATLNSLATLTFVGAFPLWLVQSYGVSSDAPLLGLTLGVFSLASAAGGVVAGLLNLRLPREFLVASSMLLSAVPLLLLFQLPPGSLLYFMTVALAGALSYAGVPLMVLSAQDLAPRQVAAASGMLFGFAGGLAGLLYMGLGQLQELIGLGAAVGLTYLVLIPAGLLAFRVLRDAKDVTLASSDSPADIVCACLSASCGGVDRWAARSSENI